MGKHSQQNQQQQNLEAGGGNQSSSTFFCDGCSKGVSRVFSLRCIVFLVLGLAVLLAGLFWVLPIRSKSGFDAKDSIRLSASVRASFRLEKPVSELLEHRGRLEREIYEEIAIPNTKVAILSMHQLREANGTEVVFAVLSDPGYLTISQTLKSILSSSLVGIFVQDTNLTLTTSIFGQASSFQILKFPGGITVNPLSSALWGRLLIRFNFTLNNTISEIQDTAVQLKNQLKFALRLRPYENIYYRVTNGKGSTVSRPVVVQADVVSLSSIGYLLPYRSRQLAQIIAALSAKNLGLDDSVFGKVKSVRLSTKLKDKPPSVPAPVPAPAPVSVPVPAPAPAPAPLILSSPVC